MYTYEDLKKAPVGTRIKFESGETLYKTSNKEDGFKGNRFYRDIEDLEGLRDNINCFAGKIIKIEEPNYTTVYEVKDILNEREKDFLSNIVKPKRIRKKIIGITKIRKFEEKEDRQKEEFIEIGIKGEVSIFFPFFKAGTMYKGMEVDREYSLEELGL